MAKTPEARPRRILGLDPGSVTTGFGVIEERDHKLALVEYGAIRCRSDAPFADRLVKIDAELELLLARCRPDEVAIEGLFEAKNARSALLLGHARGVLVVAVARRALPIAEYAPREVKKALVGNGNAEKHQVRTMVGLLLSLREPVRPLDASDGLAIAICHAHSRRLRSLAIDGGAKRGPRDRAARS